MEHSDPGLSTCGLRLLNLQTQILKPSPSPDSPGPEFLRTPKWGIHKRPITSAFKGTLEATTEAGNVALSVRQSRLCRLLLSVRGLLGHYVIRRFLKGLVLIRLKLSFLLWRAGLCLCSHYSPGTPPITSKARVGSAGTAATKPDDLSVVHPQDTHGKVF